jgi:hypothetical protein
VITALAHLGEEHTHVAIVGDCRGERPEPMMKTLRPLRHEPSPRCGRGSTLQELEAVATATAGDVAVAEQHLEAALVQAVGLAPSFSERITAALERCGASSG